MTYKVTGAIDMSNRWFDQLIYVDDTEKQISYVFEIQTYVTGRGRLVHYTHFRKHFGDLTVEWSHQDSWLTIFKDSKMIFQQKYPGCHHNVDPLGILPKDLTNFLHKRRYSCTNSMN